MRKTALAILLAAGLAAAAIIPVSAHYNGIKDPEYYYMPQVNSSNPEIKIDGVLDFENGEWNGALKYTMDYTVSDDNDRLYDFTIWSPEVWISGDFAVSSPDELPENWQPVIDNYYLWSGDGIYIATTYKTKVQAATVNADNAKSFLEYYAIGSSDTFDGNLPSNVQHMILPTDDPTAGIGSDGKWVYCYATSDQTAVWSEEYTLYTSLDSNEFIDGTTCVGYQTPTPDEDGYYTATFEMYVPWTFLNLDNYEGADTTMFDFYGAEDTIIQIGMITRIRNDPNAEDFGTMPYFQFTDSAGWAGFNFYILSTKAADYTSGESTFIVADVNNQADPTVSVLAGTSTTTEAASESSEESVLVADIDAFDYKECGENVNDLQTGPDGVSTSVPLKPADALTAATTWYTYDVQIPDCEKITFNFQYAASSDRYMDFEFNGQTYRVSCPSTGDWSTFTYTSLTCDGVSAGTYTIKMAAPSDFDDSTIKTPNVNAIVITTGTTPAERTEEAAEETTTETAAEAVEEAVDTAVETATETVEDAAETVEEAVTDAAETVADTASDAAEAVADTASDAAEAVADTATSAVETASEKTGAPVALIVVIIIVVIVAVVVVVIIVTKKKKN